MIIELIMLQLSYLWGLQMYIQFWIDSNKITHHIFGTH